MSIPAATKVKHGEIASLISPFCEKRLSPEYEALCMRLNERLCRKRPSPVINGAARVWAAGMVHALCAANSVFNKRHPLHMSAGDIAEGFGVSEKTARRRAAQLRGMFRINRGAPEWTLKPDTADFTDIFSRFEPGDDFSLDNPPAPPV